MRRFHYEMKMIPHQTIGIHLPLRVTTGARDRFQEQNPICRLKTNVLPTIPEAHHVIDRAGVFNPEGRAMTNPVRIAKMCLSLGLTQICDPL